MTTKNASDGDLGRLGQDHFDGQSGPWISNHTRNEFYERVREFNAAVDAWETANQDARQAADTLMSWANLGEQVIAIAKPIIDLELARRAAEPKDDEPKTGGLAEGLNKLKDLLAALRPLLERPQ